MDMLLGFLSGNAHSEVVNREPSARAQNLTKEMQYRMDRDQSLYLLRKFKPIIVKELKESLFKQLLENKEFARKFEHTTFLDFFKNLEIELTKQPQTIESRKLLLNEILCIRGLERLLKEPFLPQWETKETLLQLERILAFSYYESIYHRIFG